MVKSLFIDFCQIFENKKFKKNRHLGLFCHFEIFLKTFYKIEVLSRMQNVEEILEKFHFLNI
jgi:hypothetical protein